MDYIGRNRIICSRAEALAQDLKGHKARVLLTYVGYIGTVDGSETKNAALRPCVFVWRRILMKLQKRAGRYRFREIRWSHAIADVG